MAACYISNTLMQAASVSQPGVKEYAAGSTAAANSPTNHIFSVAPLPSRNFTKYMLPPVTSFLSCVNHTQSVFSKWGCCKPPLLSHSLLARHSKDIVGASSSRFQADVRGSRGYVTQFQGTVKALAADGNGKSTKPELVVCFGEMLIDFVPTAGGVSLAEAPAFKKAPGGAPANVAVGIARLGGSSAFMGKVGDDEFGHMLVNILKENRVECRGVCFDQEARTALAFVTLKADGEREFMFFRNPSADMLFDIHDIDMELLQSATVFLYGSISLIAEPCRSAHLAALEAARKAGVLLVYDPNLRLPLWPSPDAARKGIKSIWDQADIIKVSEEEITFLTDGGDPYSDEAAMQLWHPNLKLLLVTEGKDGCRFYTETFRGRVKGFQVAPVDTTGAGDAFVAGLLYQLVRDRTLLEDEGKLCEALKFANACGAIATTDRGAIPSLPDRDAVLKLMTKVTV